MPTFQYNVAPNSQGGFTTRPVLGEGVSDSVLLGQIAQKSGLTEAQATAAVHALIDTFLECATGCGHATGFLGRLRFRPTSGGSQSAPDAFDNPDEINAGVSLALSSTAIAAWRATLTLQSMGEIGKLSPIIASVLSLENGQEDHYVPGTMIQLNGENLRFNKADLTQGVFLRSGNNPEVRATVYGPISPGSVSLLVPASLSGPLSVRIAAFLNGSVRSFTYMDPIS